ncbi:hypothetical protein M8J77_018641 [Diaphorina citri]|nr:hypothetical protein M8J77_018641 [Diaphorina citri]
MTDRLTLKNERYRLKVVVDELQNAEAVDYQTVILAFINCLIISTPQLNDRIRIRNEFIGLKVLSVLNELRKKKKSDSSNDLSVQLDVFDEQKESDEAQILGAPDGVDLNSHLDVFYAVLRQVAETPQEIPFLSILQHLLRIDPKEAVSDIIWDTAETLVHRATLLESRQDATKLLRSPSLQNKLCCHGHRGDAGSGSRKPSLNNTPPPPPPPPLITPPPPPPFNIPPPMMCTPPAPPPITKAKSPVLATAEPPEPTDTVLLPQQETPVPRTKMKTINWNKIPNSKVVGRHNIWSLVARSHEHSPQTILDWAEMEGLFCQQTLSTPTPTSQSSPRASRSESADKRKDVTSEILLLDGKRSLNVNIFLKQFRSSNEDIIHLIKNGDHDEIGTEKLRGLLKILPQLDELEMLRNFDGDKSRLGNAEKFLLQLIQVPNYKLRIESMLLKEEFATNMSYLEPSINSMIVAGEDLMSNKALQEVLYMVICAGNFLNSGGYAGNAAGVKLSSLQKLTDIRANKPGMNLIHYVALQAEKKRKELLNFTEDMGFLEEATKTTVEQLQNEINALDSRIKQICKQVELPTTRPELKLQMEDFLKMADHEVTTLKEDMQELESVRKKLADFFCEDSNVFKLEECYKVFHGFCVKFKQAVAENERRRIQEEQSAARRRQREEQQLANKRKFFNGVSGDVDPSIVESLICETAQKRPLDKETKLRKVQNGGTSAEEDVVMSVPSSPAVMRRRLGSLSGDPNLNSSREDNFSPDITPTGSLRRRRSRVHNEEDNSTLMEFLRSSNPPATESPTQPFGNRKSWGSLDRSWARRARGGGPGFKKRPELLNADFYGDRERPGSPSPLVENKPIVPAPSTSEEDIKPKAWKAKIEAWLQENEKEGKQAEESTRRVPKNRWSLEDSESDGRSGTLDPLPEGKLALNTSYKPVYSEWKPTFDKTDVVGAMEAIAEAQPAVKDKSLWRKSNLNVANSTEEIEADARKIKRMKSQTNQEPVSTLQAIEEERKGFIGALGQETGDESLTVYIRRPSHAPDPRTMTKSSTVNQKANNTTVINISSTPSDKQHCSTLPPLGSSKGQFPDMGVTDKIEIDSDNIETPPATRKLLALNKAALAEKKPKLGDEVTLGDGQFDRFSAARRTRRYRKNTDEENAGRKDGTASVPTSELIPSKQLIRPNTLQVQSVAVNKLEPQDSESRLKRWKDKIQYKDTEEDAMMHITKSGEELKNLQRSATLPRSTRFRSIMNRKIIGEDTYTPVKVDGETTARDSVDGGNINVSISSMGSDKVNTLSTLGRQSPMSPKPTNVNISDNLVPSSKVKSEFIPEIRVQAITPNKHRELDMHDEGFEESQSLVSETLSQGTSSGNFEQENVSPTNKNAKLYRADSSGSADTTSSNPTRPVTLDRNKPVSASFKHENKPTAAPIKRSLSLRRASPQTSGIVKTNAPVQSTVQSKVLTPRNTQSNYKPLTRSNSVNKPQQPPVVKKAFPLEKSGSKSSLKGAPLRKKVERSNSKSSLQSSRSSLNSASSVSTIRPANTIPGIKKYTHAIKSLTENLQNTKGPTAQKTKTPVPASRSSSSGSSIGPTLRKTMKTTASSDIKENVNVTAPSRVAASRSSSSSSSIAGLSFMRPTAASTAKDAPDPTLKKLKPKLRSFK